MKQIGHWPKEGPVLDLFKEEGKDIYKILHSSDKSVIFDCYFLKILNPMQDLVGLVPSKYLINFHSNGVISKHKCMSSTITKENLIDVISGSFNQIHYEGREAPIMINSKSTNQEAT